MFNIVNFNLVKADRICDRVPVVSSLSNLVDLFQKALVIPYNKKSAVLGDYFTHLDRKNAARCAILMIPVIGNIIVALVDFASRQEKATSVPRDKQQGQSGKVYLENHQSPAGDAYRAMEKRRMEEGRKMDKLMAANQHNVTTEITSEDDAVKLVKINGMKLQELPESFKKNKKVVLAAVQQDGLAIKHAHESFKKEYDIALAAVQKTPAALEFIDKKECYDENQKNMIVFVLSEAYKKGHDNFGQFSKEFSPDLIQFATSKATGS